jgi:hypothetical protein
MVEPDAVSCDQRPPIARSPADTAPVKCAARLQGRFPCAASSALRASVSSSARTRSTAASAPSVRISSAESSWGSRRTGIPASTSCASFVRTSSASSSVAATLSVADSVRRGLGASLRASSSRGCANGIEGESSCHLRRPSSVRDGGQDLEHRFALAGCSQDSTEESRGEPRRVVELPLGRRGEPGECEGEGQVLLQPVQRHVVRRPQQGGDTKRCRRQRAHGTAGRLRCRRSAYR